MTALAIPASGLIRPRKPLWVPRFEPWRLLRPLRMDGQFFPRQTLQLDGGILPESGVSVQPPTLTYRTFQSDSSNLTTYSWSSINVGTSPCLVVVAAHASGSGSNRTISSGTIGGSAATVHGSNSGSGFFFCGLMSRAFTPGGTITIAVTWSGSCSRGGIGVWTIEDLQSNTPTDSDFTSTTTPSLAINADGIGIFAHTANINSPSASIDSGTKTDRYNSQVEGQHHFFGLDTTDNGGNSPTVTYTNGNISAAAAWR